MCFLQLHTGWHPGEEKSKTNTTYSKLEKKEGGYATTFTRKHEVLDSIMVWTLVNFSFSLTLSLWGYEPWHYVWLVAVCKFPPHLGLRGQLQVSRVGDAVTAGIASALHRDRAKPGDTSYLAPCDKQSPGFVLQVTKNIQVFSFRNLDAFFAWRS